MRLRILVCALASLALPPAAHAATVTGTTTTVDPVSRSDPSYEAPAVEVEADPGDPDDLELSGSDRVIVVRSLAGPLRPAGTCAALDPTTVECRFAPPTDTPPEYAPAARVTRVALGDGDDRLVSLGPPPFTVDAGTGDDTVDLRRAASGPRPQRRNPAVLGGSGDDGLLGSPYSDTVDGGPGKDQVRAGSGLDVVRGGPGDDVLDGGTGFGVAGDARVGEGDYLSYHRDRRIDVDLRTGRAAGAGERDRLSGFEEVFVEHGDLSGTAGEDDLTTFDGVARGLGGDDVLFASGRALGGAGDDRVGGFGRLRGGAGDDDVSGSTYDEPDASETPTSVDGGPGDDTLSLRRARLREVRAACGAGRDEIGIGRGRFGVPPDCEAIEIGYSLRIDRWSTSAGRLRLRIGFPDTSIGCRPRLRVGGIDRGRIRLGGRPRSLSFARGGVPATLAVLDDGVDCTVAPGGPIRLRFPD